MTVGGSDEAEAIGVDSLAVVNLDSCAVRVSDIAAPEVRSRLIDGAVAV